MGVGIEHDTLARLTARLDAQEEELAALRALLAGIEPGEPSLPPVTGQRVPSATAKVSAPVARRTRSASRRTLLKGAGAALFTTALLATGEIIPVTPFRVAAATPATPTGTTSRAPTVPDTLYQMYLGTDFLPETTANGYFAANPPGTSFRAGAVFANTASTNFSARVDLPQGATITEVVFYLLSNIANIMTVDMAAYAADTGTSIPIGSTASPPLMSIPTAVPLSPLTNTTVDNGSFSYVLEWIPAVNGPLQQLFGARVGYTLPNSAQLYGGAKAGIGAFGLSATGIGLLGQSDGVTGRGVKGLSDAGFPIIGTVTGAATINAGVLGVGTAGPGVQGQSSTGHGTVGTTTATDGLHTGVTGYVQPGGNAIGVRGSIPSGATGLAGVFDGDVAVVGALRVYGAPKNAAVKHADGTYRLLYCEEAPESWFADYGEGTLAGNKADITLDPDFASLVHTDTYHVFVTAHGPQHLHIAQRTATGFSVVATALTNPGGGLPPPAGGGTFSWRVVAKRKDIAGERLAKVAPPPALKAVQALTEPGTPATKPPTTKP